MSDAGGSQVRIGRLLQLAGAMLAPLVLVALLPPTSLPNYLALHTLMEVFAVLVASMIFAIGLHTAGPTGAPAMARLGAGFLAVALLDVAHLLSFEGMPELVTPSGPAKAIYFWLAARLAAALALLFFVAAPPGRRRRAWVLFAVLSVTLACWLVLGHEDALPTVYVPGQGLTWVKVSAEVVVLLVTLAAAAVVVLRPRKDLLINRELLAMAAVAMALSELPFCLYQRVTDAFNLVGHVEKVIAYLLLYRAVFLETVREPYLQLERSTTALEQSEARLRAIAEAIEVVVFLKDASTGAFLYVSPAFEKVWGRPVSEAAKLVDFTAPEDREQHRQAQREEGRRDTSLELRITRPDGTRRWVRLQTRVVRDEHGQAARVAGVAHDTTEERALHAQALINQRSESVARLATTVAHDFNNLLTVILSSASFAAEQARGNATLADDLAQITFAGQRAQDLTRQLLTFSRRAVSVVKVFDVAEVISNMAPLLSRLCQGLDVLTELAPGAHPVKLDPTNLEQVVLNLVVNAREAHPRDGTIRIVVREATGTDLANHRVADGRWVLVAVTDQGEGMTEEVKQRALDPFFTTREEGHGTGLGLATCAAVAEAAGGHLRLESKLGEGTTVEVLLPREQSLAEPDPASGPVPHGSGELILLVEDDAPVRRSAARMLKSLGYQVVEATNGLEALGMAGAQKALALVVTDLAMPGLDGRALATELQAQRPGLPVLFTSGFASGEAPTPLLPKPYAMTELARAVATALRKPR